VCPDELHIGERVGIGLTVLVEVEVANSICGK